MTEKKLSCEFDYYAEYCTFRKMFVNSGGSNCNNGNDGNNYD